MQGLRIMNMLITILMICATLFFLIFIVLFVCDIAFDIDVIKNLICLSYIISLVFTTIAYVVTIVYTLYISL